MRGLGYKGGKIAGVGGSQGGVKTVEITITPQSHPALFAVQAGVTRSGVELMASFTGLIYLIDFEVEEPYDIPGATSKKMGLGISNQDDRYYSLASTGVGFLGRRTLYGQMHQVVLPHYHVNEPLFLHFEANADISGYDGPGEVQITFHYLPLGDS